MNKTNIHNQNKNKNQNSKNSKLFVASIAIVVALTLFVSPMLNVDDALATHNKKNKAKQSIDQSQSSNQNAGCVSGGTTFLSCNNLSFQHQKNSGNNALAQEWTGWKLCRTKHQPISILKSKQPSSIRCRYNRFW